MSKVEPNADASNDARVETIVQFGKSIETMAHAGDLAGVSVAARAIISLLNEQSPASVLAADAAVDAILDFRRAKNDDGAILAEAALATMMCDESDARRRAVEAARRFLVGMGRSGIELEHLPSARRRAWCAQVLKEQVAYTYKAWSPANQYYKTPEEYTASSLLHAVLRSDMIEIRKHLARDLDPNDPALLTRVVSAVRRGKCREAIDSHEAVVRAVLRELGMPDSTLKNLFAHAA